MPTSKENMKRLQREWLEKRRNAFFEGKCCAKCGSTQDLQLARLESGQSLRGIWSWSEARRVEVLAECQVLCGQHGKEERSLKRGARVVHGTEWMYMSRGCRCPECVQAASDARQRRRGK